MKYLVIAHFTQEKSIAYKWFDTKDDAREWIEWIKSYEDDSNDFVVDEFLKINDMEKLK